MATGTVQYEYSSVNVDPNQTSEVTAIDKDGSAFRARYNKNTPLTMTPASTPTTTEEQPKSQDSAPVSYSESEPVFRAKRQQSFTPVPRPIDSLPRESK